MWWIVKILVLDEGVLLLLLLLCLPGHRRRVGKMEQGDEEKKGGIKQKLPPLFDDLNVGGHEILEVGRKIKNLHH